MAGRMLKISCSEAQCQLLSKALGQYAQAAFPPGGSECAQASREQLLGLAERFVRQQVANGSIEVASRQRGMLRGAIKVYFDSISDDAEDLRQAQKQQLLTLLKK